MSITEHSTSLAADLRAEGFAGEAVLPGDAGYDAARAIWNAIHDRRPAVVARCTSPRDVAAAIAVARRHDLPLAVRGGGHSIPGHSSCDGGIVADLGPMSRVEVEPGRRHVRAGGGALLRDLDQATQAYGLAVPAGHVSHTGVAGLTLGGGIGWTARSRGLTIDSLRSAQVVTAGGQVVEAGEDVNADLFWGLRGGGGNFGVVTELRFEAQAVGTTVLGGPLLFELDRAVEAFMTSRAVVEAAGDEMNIYEVLITVPPAPEFPPELHGRRVLVVGVCWTGAPEAGRRALAPLLALRPALDGVAPIPYLAQQTMLDPTAPHGLHTYSRAHWVGGDDEAVITRAVAAFEHVTSPLAQLIFARMGGAIERVPAEATAFGHRDAHGLAWLVNSWAPGPDEARFAEHKAWLDGVAAGLAPYATGVYVNALEDEGPDRVRAAYRQELWRRLVEVKDRWDPENVFRLNQNVPPSGWAAAA
ncbi:MAG TPA: FAD-binding oxidoreductase [Solirubrobacteraceae bacterium]|nr:FAD-binding oxidoreductase [Solirubrobacteraceae bacterium]